jgi:hypothetical protein
MAMTAFAVSASPAAAAGPGVVSTPEWLPLRGDHLIGCAYNGTGNICGGNYHPYWAIDIKAALGESVYPAGAGKVIEAVTDQGGNCDPAVYARPEKCPGGSKGNHVLIDHGSNLYSYYQHMRSVSVKVGDWVDETTVIGAVGDSGYSDPGFYHVHYERRSGSTTNRVDPGPLKGCVGPALKSYPRDLTPAGAGTSWQGLAGHRYTAHSDGSACAKTTTGGGTSGKPRIDLVFAIDTTGSMGPYIAAVQASARAIAAALLTTADARVALVDYKDLYAGCPSDGYAARIDLPFSTDAAGSAPPSTASRQPAAATFPSPCTPGSWPGWHCHGATARPRRCS